MALTLKPELYCTALDVMTMILDLSTEKINYSQLPSIVVRPSNMLENYILQGDQMVNMALAQAYPTITSWRTTPWATPPVTPINPQTGTSSNTGNGVLLSVKPNAVTVNAAGDTTRAGYWIAKCTTNMTAGNKATGDYAIWSSNWGSQGTSKSFNSDITSTLGEVTIETDGWIDGSETQTGIDIDANDSFFFSIETAKKPVWMLSLTIATALTLNSVYLDMSNQASPFGSMFFTRATKMLDMIAKKELSIEAGLASLDIIPPTQIQYMINDYGTDDTKYMNNIYETYRSS